MAKQVDNKIVDISEQQKLFIITDEEGDKEIDLTRRFRFRVWYRAQVPTGQVWQVYRDGVFYEQLQAGPHDLWNALWHQWKALRINLRIVHLSFTFDGRVKGPPLPREAQSSAGIDLGCTVTARLELPCKLVDIEKFLQYENPLFVFGASLKNMVIEMIGKLPYDQFGEWATTLRDMIRARLQGGRNDTIQLIGMKVEEVYVTEVQPNSQQDRSMLAMYLQVERVRRELAEAQANRQRDTEVAQSFADQGSILNIAPAILALQNSPVGKELIARDADLRKMMVAAGLNPGVSVQPLRDPQAQLGAGPAPAVGYLNPPAPAPSGSYPAGNTGPMAFASGSLQPISGTSGPAALPPAPASGPFVDPARQDSELAALQAAGFQCAGRGQHVPMFDSNGQPIPGSMEWVLEVYVQRISGYITIVFHCPSGYPAVAPKVQVRGPRGGGLQPITPNAVRTWKAHSTLAEVVHEIDNNTP